MERCPGKKDYEMTLLIQRRDESILNGRGGDIALTFNWGISLKSNCEMNVFNIASGQGFMEWRDSCTGHIT